MTTHFSHLSSVGNTFQRVIDQFYICLAFLSDVLVREGFDLHLYGNNVSANLVPNFAPSNRMTVVLLSFSGMERRVNQRLNRNQPLFIHILSTIEWLIFRTAISDLLRIVSWLTLVFSQLLSGNFVDIVVLGDYHEGPGLDLKVFAATHLTAAD